MLFPNRRHSVCSAQASSGSARAAGAIGVSAANQQVHLNLSRRHSSASALRFLNCAAFEELVQLRFGLETYVHAALAF